VTALRISVNRREDGVAVSLSGELDLAEVERIRRRMRKVDEERPEVLYVDLRRLSFLDSSGLQALVEIDGQARADGRRAVFVRGDRAVQRLFELTRLDERLEFVDELPAE
jgi:anti-sigma B factor antagonist/stage II sporulation protein AA (anti-sigma F factor antagonist)